MAIAVAPVRVALRGFPEPVSADSAPRWGQPIWPAEERREAQPKPSAVPIEMLIVVLGRNSG